MYHSVSDEPEPGVPPYYRVNTSPAVFRQHMQFLADHGYRTISLSALVQSLSQASGLKPQVSSLSTLNSQPSTKLVALTFDDGFQNFYTEAFPVLQEFGFTATVFLATAFIGDTRRVFRPRGGLRSQPSTLNPQPSTSLDCLTWSEVRELARSGIHFGSHTVNHPKLLDLPWTEVRSEILNSKSEIEQRLEKPVTAFCYPYAFPQAQPEFVHTFRETLVHAGYVCCATTRIGRARSGDSAFALKRVPINDLDDTRLLNAKLAGNYDYMSLAQLVFQVLRSVRA